mmetsp:Transcript_27768/g.76430  ORF Transcript_27768/g.76430 Transcript_27768/m.76430 type:complete len:311 (-) Transcript_27768:292-1224(-)
MFDGWPHHLLHVAWLMPALHSTCHGRIIFYHKGLFLVSIVHRLCVVLDVVENTQTLVDLIRNLHLVDWPILEDLGVQIPFVRVVLGRIKGTIVNIVGLHHLIGMMKVHWTRHWFVLIRMRHELHGSFLIQRQDFLVVLLSQLSIMTASISHHIHGFWDLVNGIVRQHFMFFRIRIGTALAPRTASVAATRDSASQAHGISKHDIHQLESYQGNHTQQKTSHGTDKQHEGAIFFNIARQLVAKLRKGGEHCPAAFLAALHVVLEFAVATRGGGCCRDFLLLLLLLLLFARRRQAAAVGGASLHLNYVLVED